MSWAGDLNNVRHMLALGAAEREFGKEIEEGVGTCDQFAQAILTHSARRPGVSMERVIAELKGALALWRTEQRTKQARLAITDLLSSAEE